MTRLMNNGLIREERLGRMLAVKVGPTFADARRAYAEHLGRWEEIIERVVDLFMRVDTYQAEMMATVLYAAKGLAREAKERPSERDVLGAVMEWKQRRKPALDEQAVAVTVRDLASLGWWEERASEDPPLPEEMMSE